MKRQNERKNKIWAATSNTVSQQLVQQYVAVFSFLYLKKNKISKIYVRFQIFQKYTPVALP